jgi:anti-sigma B factor antagonist
MTATTETSVQVAHDGAPALIKVGLARLGDTTVVCLHGDLDVQTAPYFRDVLSVAVTVTRGDLVVVAQDVTRLDAAGIGVLVGGMRRARADARSLRVAAPSPHVQRLLRLTGLHHLLRSHGELPDGWQDPCPLP